MVGNEGNDKLISKAMNFLQEKKVKLVEFIYVDYDGIARGKVISVEKIKSHLNSGIGITKAMFAMSAHDELASVANMTAVGEVRLIPDLTSLRMVPRFANVATVMCNHYQTNGSPYLADPRLLLKEILGELSNMGLDVLGTYENEFTLFKLDEESHKKVSAETHPCFSTSAVPIFYEQLDDVWKFLKESKIDIEQYYPEAGFGQHELTMSPTNFLTAADNEIRFKRAIKYAMSKSNLYASFAPKPILNTEGNGGHIHFSLWYKETGENAFFSKTDPLNLSQIGYYFIGGMLKHIESILSFTCPSVNSYQRLKPSEWSSAYATYGKDNREAAIRVPSTFWTNQASSMNIELKASDASANPYLAFSAILIAGIDGIKNKLLPGKYVDVDPASLTEKQRQAYGVKKLPLSLQQSLNKLKNDNFFLEKIPHVLIDAYVKVKQADIRYYDSLSDNQIAEDHRDTY